MSSFHQLFLLSAFGFNLCSPVTPIADTDIIIIIIIYTSMLRGVCIKDVDIGEVTG